MAQGLTRSRQVISPETTKATSRKHQNKMSGHNFPCAWIHHTYIAPSERAERTQIILNPPTPGRDMSPTIPTAWLSRTTVKHSCKRGRHSASLYQNQSRYAYPTSPGFHSEGPSGVGLSRPPNRVTISPYQITIINRKNQKQVRSCVTTILGDS